LGSACFIADCLPLRKSRLHTKEADMRDDDVASFWIFAPRGGQPQKRLARGDRSAQSDRKFFERFPHRRHRVRFASQAERQQVLNGRLPPAFKLYTVVRNVRDGARLRAFLPAPAGRETDVDEATAKAIFEMAAPPNTKEIEAQLCRSGGFT
jgi:hypothetical protein